MDYIFTIPNGELQRNPIAAFHILDECVLIKTVNVLS